MNMTTVNYVPGRVSVPSALTRPIPPTVPVPPKLARTLEDWIVLAGTVTIVGWAAIISIVPVFV